MDEPARILALYESSGAALKALEAEQELSFLSDMSSLLTKGLLLACVSHYENEIMKFLAEIVNEGSYDENVKVWVYRKAINRKFFTLFDFETKNTNRFLKTFGDDFKKNTRALIDGDECKKEGERSFLSLCFKRNQCVHKNFASYNLELSLDDIYLEHKRAMAYIEVVEYSLRNWLDRPSGEAVST